MLQSSNVELGDELITVVRVDGSSLPGNTSGDKYGSFSGAGTLEIQDVTKLLGIEGITCCIVGVGALKYYGAGRVLHEWEICVPTNDFQRAEQILTSPPYDQLYQRCSPREPQIFSMLHTFPLFKLKGIAVWFYIVPSDDCHIKCLPANLEYSKTGLPYPKLPIFAKSLLDTLSLVALTDLVDGMDLDDEWASENLDLSGTQDVEWIRQKNKKIEDASPSEDPPGRSTEPRSLRNVWKRIVDTKERRIGLEYPPGVLVTRFRVAGTGDPRCEERTYV